MSFYEIERVDYHPETKERKLQGKRYFLIELLNFVTIIDLFGDMKFFKTQITRGNGIRRINNADKIRGKLKLEDYKGNCLWQFSNEDQGLNYFKFCTNKNLQIINILI